MGQLEVEGDQHDAVLEKICLMVKGSTMLKAGRLGKPHFRNFCLSDDLLSLEWESPNKGKAATQVLIKNIKKLLRGQKTKVFENNPMPEYEGKSFSLLYDEETGTVRSLDIVCKDRAEYEIWTDGIDALLNGFSNVDGVNRLKDNLAGLASKVSYGIVGDRVYVEDDACDIYTWGASPDGTLGHGEEEEELVPRAVKAILGKDIRMVACGSNHTIVITDEGETFSMGSGRGGKLGLGNILDHYMPLKIGSLSEQKVSYIACNKFHSAVISSGELYTFGKSGPWLGYHTNERKQTIPMKIDSLSQYAISKVSCGTNFTIALSSFGGDLFAFGENIYGQLGVGHNKSEYLPIKLKGFGDEKMKITNISCGANHSAAVSKDGQVYIWGSNEFGQLGLGDTEDRNIPTIIDTGLMKEEKIKDVKCGGQHTVMLSHNGKIFCCGNGEYGQLGVDLRQFKTSQLLTAVHVPTVERIFKIDCGDAHTAAVTEKGALYTWGKGSKGRLGHGDHGDRYTPTLVESLSYRRVESVFCGFNHTAACVIQAWIKDEEVLSCMACQLLFTMIRRRHHCRKCGGVFCYACTTHKIPILEIGHIDPVLVCDPCYNVLTR